MKNEQQHRRYSVNRYTSQRNHRKSPIKNVLETVACRRSKILTVLLILSSIQCAIALCCAYLWFPINCWLDGFKTNIHHWQAIVPTYAFNSAVYCVFSTTIGQLLAGQCSVVQYIKMWSRLNCWLVRVFPTKMSQLMADRWSVRYVPVASFSCWLWRPQLMCRPTPWSTGTCCLHSAASARRCGGCYGNVRVWLARKIHYHSPPHHPHNLACPLD